MNRTELILAPGTSPEMKKLVESLPPYDLLKAYRDARHTFATGDIVLAIATEENVEGFLAFPRSVYVEKAFERWNDVQRAAHPLASEPAHKRLQMPEDAQAFWLVIEMPQQQAVGCVAIGTYLHKTDEVELS
jgi:hypothetical protein